MSVLDGFDMCGETKEKPFLTLRSNTLTFSKSSIDLLGKPEFVHAFIDTKNSRYAIQPCSKEQLALQFYVEPKPGKQAIVRWANKDRISDLTEIVDIKKYPKGVRIYGDYIREENVIIYDLKDTKEVK